MAAGQPRAGLPGSEDPDRLGAALDVDLYCAPLFNTLPIRRTGLLTAPVGTEHQMPMVFVRTPSLEVVLAEQVYEALGDGQLRFTSGTFAADLTIDADGYVTHYPGLAAQRP